MRSVATVESLGREMRTELTCRILPYWRDRVVDHERGGFHGYIGPHGVPQPDAPRGAILNGRILWTFSAAYRALGDVALRTLADRAAAVIVGPFTDDVHGGVYWMVDPDGRPVDERKHIYAQAFAIYGLSEHHRATAEASSLRAARTLFERIEEHASDAEHGGYEEAFSRDWVVLDDVRLSVRDLNARKSHNTHLHLLEAYTALYRVWPDPTLAARLRSLVEILLDRIVDPGTGHTRPFFDADWSVRSAAISYGHDIETAWLVKAAADGLDEPDLCARTRETALLLADTALREGSDPWGGMFYAADAAGTVDPEKEWWTQAEAVVGFLDAYQQTARPDFLDAAWDTWVFIRTHMRDRRHGEWYRRVARDGTPQPQHEKVGPWKGPYHNVRACLEVMERTHTLQAAGS